MERKKERRGDIIYMPKYITKYITLSKAIIFMITNDGYVCSLATKQRSGNFRGNGNRCCLAYDDCHPIKEKKI